jgi:putative membrane protein
LQKSLENTVSQPVELSHSLQHNGHGNGWLMAALVALVLWLAAVAGALRGDPSASLRQTAAPVSSRRLAFSRLLPVLGLAVLEAAGVLVALLVLNVGAADVVGFVVLTVVAALTFTAVAYATRLMLGRPGIAALVAILIVQIAALGNVIPLETAPGPLRALNAVLPLPAYVDGASQLLTGGSVGSRAVDLLVLIAWGAAGCLATVLTIRRRRLEPRSAAAPAAPVSGTPAPASA